MMGVWLTSLIYRFPIWAWKHRKTAADAAWPWSLLVPPVFVSSNCEGYVTVIESQVRWNCEFCSENPHPCGRLCLTWLLVHDFGVLTPGPMCPPWWEQLLQTTYWLDTGAFQRTKNGWAVSLSLSLQLTWKEDEIFRCLKRRGYCKGSIKNPIHFFFGWKHAMRWLQVANCHEALLHPVMNLLRPVLNLSLIFFPVSKKIRSDFASQHFCCPGTCLWIQRKLL